MVQSSDGEGGNLRIFVTGACGWEVGGKNYSYKGQTEQNIPIHTA